MDTKFLNFGGDKPMRFMLGIERSTMTPSWIGVVDELWLHDVGNKLYNAVRFGHYINTKVQDPKDFAVTMNIDAFHKMIFNGEALRFQDMVKSLIDFTLREGLASFENLTMYITFMSETSSHAIVVSAQFKTGTISFGANLDDKLSEMNKW